MRITVLVFLVCCLSQPAWAKIVVSNSSPKQGETIEITWEPGDGGGLLDYKTSPLTSIAFNNNKYRLFGGGLPLRCLLAIPADLAPGQYLLGPILIPNKSADGGEDILVSKEQVALTVKDAKFPVQHLSLPKKKDNFIMSPGEEEAMNKAKAALSDARLWKGLFTKPCQARISSVFGIRRIVNGKLLKDYYHSGVDFAGNLGQPVTACADGKVVLAHSNFKLHGNVLALDHGQGVVTIYIHLQKIMVKEGDIVKAGQQIGAVGATGRANGPHLHLSLYVNQVAANPMQWFSKTF